MTKRIILSLFMITVTVAAVTSATVAYFQDVVVKGANTFATGTVNLDESWTSGFPFQFTNLAPGTESSSGVLGVGYGGSITADFYFGIRGDSGDDLRSILQYKVIEVTSAGDPIRTVSDWRNVDYAFANWDKIADNVSSGNWRYYKVYVKVSDSATDSFQGKTATNSVIIYAVQDGQTPPASPAPWKY